MISQGTASIRGLPDDNVYYGLLYKIKNSLNETVGYLFGTIHEIDSAGPPNLDRKIFRCLDRSQSLSCEIDLSLKKYNDYFSEDSDSSKESQEKVLAGVKKDYYRVLKERKGTEAVLLTHAVSRRIKINGLETEESRRAAVKTVEEEEKQFIEEKRLLISRYLDHAEQQKDKIRENIKSGKIEGLEVEIVQGCASLELAIKNLLFFSYDTSQELEESLGILRTKINRLIKHYEEILTSQNKDLGLLTSIKACQARESTHLKQSAWKSGAAKQIKRLTEDPYQELGNRVLHLRDCVMVNSMHLFLLESTKTSRSFFAIGAAHLLGDYQNAKKMLREKGWTLVRVLPGAVGITSATAKKLNSTDQISTLPHQITDRVCDYLPDNDLRNLAQTNKHFTTLTKEAELQRAKEFGFQGSDPAAARVFLNNLFKVITVLINRGDLPDEFIIYSYGHVDPEATLKNLITLNEKEREVYISALNSALFRYARAGNQEMLGHLIQLGANIGFFDEAGSSLLGEAVEAGDAETAAFLLKLGALEKEADWVMTEPGPLLLFLHRTGGYQAVEEFMQARASGHAAVAKLLLSDKLLRAVKRKKTETVKKLIEHGADVNSTFILSGTSSTPLILALKLGVEEIVKLLIEKGAETANEMNAAIVKNNIPVVQLLLQHGLDLNTADQRGRIPLHTAINNGNLRMAELLIDKGADVNAADDEGSTPLHTAIYRFNLNTVELLTRHGADIETVDQEGCTPLLMAIDRGEPDIAKFLIEKGANVNAADNKGLTPLLMAIHCGYMEIAELLIEKGADFCAADHQGSTPLLAAIRKGNSEAVQLLLVQGADINAADHKGVTPLRMAIDSGHKDITELLVAKGADVNALLDDMLHF